MLWLLTQISLARDYTVILQSDDYPQYELPAQAFIDSSNATTKRYQLHGKKERAENFGQSLAEDPPPLIVAFGAKAAWTAQKYLPEVPLLYAMVENPSRYGIQGDNVYGISMVLPHDLTLSHLRFLIPDVEKIGLIASPSYSKELLEQTQATALTLGINADLLLFSDSNALRKELDHLKQFDALWLLPDQDLISNTFFYALSNISIRARVPLLTSSAALTEAGGLLGIVPNLNSIGEQTAELAENILGGTPPPTIQDPFDIHVILNSETQRQIGIDFPEDVLYFIHQEVGQ